MASPTTARGNVPRQLAVIDADHCTGCQACVEVCPVDCIELIQRGAGVMGIDTWCEIDLERCIGCELCVHIPRKRTDPYELTICPWNAIEMVPTEHVAARVAEMGGPAAYVRENRGRQLAAAHRVARLRHAAPAAANPRRPPPSPSDTLREP